MYSSLYNIDHICDLVLPLAVWGKTENFKKLNLFILGDFLESNEKYSDGKHFNKFICYNL